MILVPRRRGLAWAEYGVPAGVDPYWANVVSLVNWEDGYGAPVTTGPFYDYASQGVWTRQGTGPQVSSSFVKYGAMGFLTGIYGVYQPDSTDWDMGSGAFTIELWAYPVSANNGFGNPNQLLNKGWVLGQYAPFYLTILTSGAVQFLASTSGSAWDVNISGGSLSLNVWYHIAVTRSGDVYRLFVDGTQVATATVSGALMTNSNPLMIANEYGAGIFYGGNLYLDDIRITKGVARYTSNFTAPTEAFPIPAEARLVWNPTYKSADVSISESGVRVTKTSASAGTHKAFSVVARGADKRYIEIELVNRVADDTGVGLANSGVGSGALGSDTNAWTLWSDGTFRRGGAPVSIGSAWVDGDVIMIAYDPIATKVWYGVNGTWLTGSDPAAGTGAHDTSCGGTLRPAVDCYSGDTTSYRIRCASAYSYSPPSGFSAWEA